MTKLYRAELRKPDPNPSVVAKLSNEIRLCEKQAVDFVARVKVSLGQGIPSVPHQRASQTRWQRERAQRPTRGA
jgi:hypothetical protein